jgi:hypothetical protein
MQRRTTSVNLIDNIEIMFEIDIAELPLSISISISISVEQPLSNSISTSMIDSMIDSCIVEHGLNDVSPFVGVDLTVTDRG